MVFIYIRSTLYSTLVDNLVYLTIIMLDIAYDVHVVGQFTTSPNIICWTIIVCNIRYIRCIQFQSLIFSPYFLIGVIYLL